MAKTAQKGKTKEDDSKRGKDVAVDKRGGPPAALAKEMAAGGGGGLSKRQEDNIIPMIYVLQSNSPQVTKGPKAIKGAAAGDLWLRNSGEPIAKTSEDDDSHGDNFILFQPCAFWVDFVEWIPRKKGGGYVGRHDKMPSDAVKKPDPEDPENSKKFRFVRKNGNEIKETRYYGGRVLGRGSPQSYVIPLSGSGHAFAKMLMTTMNNKLLPDGKTTPDSWACVYKFRTKFRTNSDGEWYMLDFDDADTTWVQTMEDVHAGAALNRALTSGMKRAEDFVDDAVDGKRVNDDKM